MADTLLHRPKKPIDPENITAMQAEKNYGISHSTIYSYCKAFGYGHYQNDVLLLTLEDLAKIKKNLENQAESFRPGPDYLTAAELSKKYGFNYCTMRTRLFKHKVPVLKVHGYSYIKVSDYESLCGNKPFEKRVKGPRKTYYVKKIPEGYHPRQYITDKYKHQRATIDRYAARLGIGQEINGHLLFTDEDIVKLNNAIDARHGHGNPLSHTEPRKIPRPRKETRPAPPKLPKEVKETRPMAIKPKPQKVKVERRPRNYWKIGVWSPDLFAYRIVKVCMKKEDAQTIEKTLITIGINAQATPHVRGVRK